MRGLRRVGHRPFSTLTIATQQQRSTASRSSLCTSPGSGSWPRSKSVTSAAQAATVAGPRFSSPGALEGDGSQSGWHSRLWPISRASPSLRQPRIWAKRNAADVVSSNHFPCFPFKNKELGKRGSTCLACMAAYGREHYARNRAKYLEKAHRRRGRVRSKNDERILAYLLEHPCVDCGETEPLVLDFDHRESSRKADEVSRLAHRRPWRVVLEEIEKCDVRCANCHRRKTARQFGWSKLELVPTHTIIPDAGVAQLAERDFPKVEVAGSCPVSRSERLDVVRASYRPPGWGGRDA